MPPANAPFTEEKTYGNGGGIAGGTWLGGMAGPDREVIYRERVLAESPHTRWPCSPLQMS